MGKEYCFDAAFLLSHPNQAADLEGLCLPYEHAITLLLFDLEGRTVAASNRQEQEKLKRLAERGLIELGTVSDGRFAGLLGGRLTEWGCDVFRAFVRSGWHPDYEAAHG